MSEMMWWTDTPTEKPETALFSKEELEQLRATLSPKAQAEFDRFVADGFTLFKPEFVEDVKEAAHQQTEQAEQPEQIEPPVAQEQPLKPWEPSDGHPNKNPAEPERR
jgi:hypothetical protein